VSEVYPLSMRAKGVSIGGSANWLNNFAVGLATSPFIGASNFGTFIFFGIMSVLAILFLIFFVPETKGRTLEEMDELFGAAGFAEADNALKARIEKEIGLTALIYGNGAGGVESEKISETGMDEKIGETAERKL